jgi:hypothetical protein
MAPPAVIAAALCPSRRAWPNGTARAPAPRGGEEGTVAGGVVTIVECVLDGLGIDGHHDYSPSACMSRQVVARPIPCAPPVIKAHIT